ncbi:MAG TPA: protoheme IX farnesyltransferase, partial [Gammaproteobacteria bacterium]|nr:protoheme IX farnesyltransferase [Gammaproteobacteria bacterium]
LFGAAPPLFGWTAVTNSIDPGGLLLVLIIFAWTPPHFWALALERKDEYADVGMPMLPVTHGEAYTRLHILLYTILLVVASVLPFVIVMSGPVYLAGALALGAGFLYWAIVLMRNNNDKAPMETFRYSIVYLGALFLVMLIDHYLFVSMTSTAPIQMTPLSA